MNPTDVFLARERLRGAMTPTPLVRHPLLDDFFGGFSGGRYRRREALN